MLDKCMFKLLQDFAVKEIFSYELLNARKEEKLSTDELPPRGVQDSPLSFFCPTSRSSQESKGFFANKLHTRASTGKPRKPLSPPGLVYRHKKGDVRKSRKKKERKRPRKARRWLQRRQGSVCPKPRLPFFWFISIWV
jgi:hypothetical protein